ncbi:MAG: carbohydrate ABC transporter permease [Lachnospiraceae bacterium]|nr:carbohydrate ABC transporter permease [Lachnospiraceae bacterium]
MKKRNRGFQIFSIVFLAIACIMIIIPFLLLIISSFTDENALMTDGYSFFPKKWSLGAYEYVFGSSGMIVKSYGYSVIVTAVGTVLSLVITGLMAYPLSRKDFRYRNFFTFMVFFTMLFNGGLVSQYIMWTQLIVVKNTILAYIIPNLLMSGFNVMIIRNFFSNDIPFEIIEAAKIDGSGEFNTFLKIVLPMSKPIFAAIGILTALGYWNNWTNGLYFITKPELYTFQNLLNRMIQQVNFLSSGSTVINSSQVKIPSVGIRMAIATIGVVPLMVMYPFFQKYFAKGLTVGAVKG